MDAKHQRQIIIASNRGPVQFEVGPGGEVVTRRGSGGLVTALSDTLSASGGLWIASAMTDEDRRQAAAGRVDVVSEDLKYGLRYLSFESDVYDRYYNGITNRVLWFLHHYLWDTARTPVFDLDTYRSWDAFRDVNQAFAEALAEEGGHLGGSPAYLVQDYQLSLVPDMLRRLNRDAAIVHFSHIPFAGPRYIRMMPEVMRLELFEGLLGADVLGFHSDTWAQNFLLGCRSIPGAAVDPRRRAIRWRDRTVRVGVYPIAIDARGLKEETKRPEVRAARRALTRWREDSRVIVRVDRTDLSKNIIRGFLAFEEMIREHPEWRRRVRFLALLNPSRQDMEEYQIYTDDCVEAVQRVNRELGAPGWQPIELFLREDYPNTLAAYEQYDVMVVNPVYDGMNLVAKEGPALNRRGGVLILSENAGAFHELGRYALGVNPFDIHQTAEAMWRALEMGEDERVRRARGLRAAVRRNTPDRWVSAQLADLARIRPVTD
ncbi:MAG TPA: trehalose-6-phosphate synthase [Actinomycetota bacterium]|jgi:trehalose 6-phosphate synthase